MGQSKIIAGPLVGVQWRDPVDIRPLDVTLQSLVLHSKDGISFVMLRHLLNGGASAHLRSVSDREIEDALDRLASMRHIHCPDGRWRAL